MTLSEFDAAVRALGADRVMLTYSLGRWTSTLSGHRVNRVATMTELEDAIALLLNGAHSTMGDGPRITADGPRINTAPVKIRED